MSLQTVNDLVVRGKAKLITAAVQEALNEGCDASEILATMISAKKFGICAQIIPADSTEGVGVALLAAAL